LNCDLILLQETQENALNLFKEKMDDKYRFGYSAPNHPTVCSISNGLLILTEKDQISTKRNPSKEES